MVRSFLVRAVLVTVIALLSAGWPRRAMADEASTVTAATEKVREALPPPTPAISLDYEGDIVVDGLWIGEIKITARAARVGRQTVWRISQTVFQDLGVQGEVRARTKLHLARDLSILSGTFEFSNQKETVSLVISRIDKGFLIQRRKKVGEDWKAAEMLELPAPARASGGLAALLLFLRAAPAQTGTRYALPWVGTEEWLLRGTPKTAEPLQIRIEGEATFKTPAKERESWCAASGQGAGQLTRMHLSRDRRSLLGIAGAEGTKMMVVPRGEGGTRDVETEEGKPAETWKDAFLKFGYGYHMAQRAQIEASFHWDRMYEHETKTLKRWPADRPLEDFKKAWVDEFIANSKRRTMADTKRLLAMTLATGKIKKQTDALVIFAAHPNFGGGVQRTYHFEKRKGVWGIVRIDF